MEHADTGMIIGCYVAIIGCYIAVIGCYVWTFRLIQGQKDMLFKHETQLDTHQSSKDLMFKDVCDERVKRIEDKIKNVQSDVSEVKTGMDRGFSEIKALLRGKV